MRYIGLLRAVNVGGKKKIKMAELRDALATLDLQHVRTYIQSGNILFDPDDTEDSLHQRIEHHIEQRFGSPVEIILRTLPEFDSLVAALLLSMPHGTCRPQIRLDCMWPSSTRHHLLMPLRHSRTMLVQKSNSNSTAGRCICCCSAAWHSPSWTLECKRWALSPHCEIGRLY